MAKPMIKDYVIIPAERICELENLINQYLADGYVLQGGVFFQSKSECYCQAVCKPC